MPDRSRRVQAELRPGDQEHRAAADAVEQRDHLRHRGHLHLARRRHADGGAQRDAEGDQAPVALERVEQRGDHRDRHADGRDAVAAHGGGRAREPAQTLDEQREGDDVEDVAEALALQEAWPAAEDHGPSPCPRRRRPCPRASCGLGLDLNISSMRSVTRKPPTTLIVPKAMAITRMTLLKVSLPARPMTQQAAEQHDPVDRVGARHQRRVQRVGHLRDDDEADEAGQHEDREVGREGAREDHGAASTAALAPGWTISPSRTMHAPADDLIVEVELQGAVLADEQLEQREHVAREQLRGVLGHARGQVQRRDDLDVVANDGLARHGQLAVPARLAGEVDDHRARLHPFDSLRGHELGRRAAGHERRRDDHVEALDRVGQRLLLAGALLSVSSRA